VVSLPGRRGHADRHQPKVAVDADDPFLPRHPFGGVVGDADDHLQVRRFTGRWRGCGRTANVSSASKKSRRTFTG
jgi:hypothetical protein